MPYAQCNDIRLFYQRRGQWAEGRTPLLCVPGLGNDSTRWERVLPLLETRFPLLVLDNRGAGRSDAPAEDYSAAQLASDAATLLDQLGVARVHALGHSMGGFAVQELAASRPELVHGLVLASTCPVMSARDRQLLRLWLQGIEAGVDAAWVTRDIFFWMYPPGCFEEPGFMDQLVREALEAPYVQPLEGLAGQIAACTNFDGRALLPRIQAPALALHGDQDMLVPLSVAEAMAAALPRCGLHVIEGSGHLPHQQMPEVFAEAVCAFLERL